MKNTRSNTLTFWKVIGFVGALASIVGLAYAMWTGKQSYDIEVLCSNYENLTKTKIQNISSKFLSKYYYEDEEVDDLWRIQLSFANTSNNTIIANGPQKNITNDSTELVFSLLEGITIMDANKHNTENQFPHNLLIEENKIRIQFKQWRPSEKVNYSFYIASISQEDTTTQISKRVQIPEDYFKLNRIFKVEKFRQIIDGDIIYKVKASPNVKNNELNALRVQPAIITLNAIGKFFLYFFALATGLIALTSPYSYYKRRKWFKENRRLYIDYLNSIYPNDRTLRKKYQKSPSKLPKSYWIKFIGERYPKMFGDMETDNIFLMIYMTLLMSLLTVSIIVTQLF